MKKQEPQTRLRRSERLNEIWEKAQSQKEETDQQYLQRTTKTSHRKRKRSEAIESTRELDQTKKHTKRARISAASATFEENQSRGAANAKERDRDPIVYWTQHSWWPTEYFDQGTEMSYLLARKKSDTALVRKKSDTGSPAPSSTTPSDEKPREAKSAPYKDARYEILLRTRGSFVDESESGITKGAKDMCNALLSREQTIPRDSLFRDDLFQSTMRKMRSKNETWVIRDISLLIVPSAEILATYGADNLECMIESVNEGWNNSIPLTKPRPQPDYAVGFRRESFTNDHLKKIEPFVGSLYNVSYFMATYYMYFPFLTCEAKCGAAALDIADRQNAHSITLAVRGVIEHFRYVGREKELDREILAFSISHDHRSVRIYGHYAVIDGSKQEYYRHPICDFSFTELDGKEKWTAYKFIKNVYNVWMPKHFERICSAINQFPAAVDFGVSQSELRFSEASGLSQELESAELVQTHASSQSSQKQSDGQSSIIEASNVTPSTSMNDSSALTRPRRKRGRRMTRTSSP